MFVDQAKVILKAGKGGNGCVSFRREKFVPRGGPDGGDGGDGGSIYFKSDPNLTTLSYFRFHSHIRAEKGAHGEGKNKTGRKGADLVIPVPVGTIVRCAETKKILYDFSSPGQVFLAAKGGKGGRGNASFASSTNRAPRKFEPGKEGEEKELILELKLIADVGLIGFPNVGKSTLISKISSAKPLIADYPFTTLYPHLGVVDIDEENSFVVADLPGLIENAHLGKGLGIKFLKHIERTKLLVHLIDISPYSLRDPVKDYYTIQKELESFNQALIKKPQILVANKIDLLTEDKKRLREIKGFAKRMNIPFCEISALKGTGLKKFISLIYEILNSYNKKITKEAKEYKVRC